MRVLVTVHWNAPRGGLHEHVVAQCRAIVGAGHAFEVVCPPGDVADRLAEAGARVFPWDRVDAEAIVEADRPEPIDLVHAHPGVARELGLEVAHRLGVPFILTLHGTRVDGLPAYRDDVDALFTVSDAIRDHVAALDAFPLERIFVVRNGVDVRTFSPAQPRTSDGIATIGIATRFDRDKRFVADVIDDCWRDQARHREAGWRWCVAGEGTVESQLPRLERSAERLRSLFGPDAVTYAGWLDGAGLASFFAGCDVVVASGRGAAEAMACGRVTIALGSRGYLGPMDEDRAWSGLYGNFGGLGEMESDYRPGALASDITLLLEDRERMRRIEAFSGIFARATLDQTTSDRQMLAAYEAVVASGPRRRTVSLATTVAPAAPLAAKISADRETMLALRLQVAALAHRSRKQQKRIASLRRRNAAIESSRWWRLGLSQRRARRSLRQLVRRIRERAFARRLSD